MSNKKMMIFAVGLNFCVAPDLPTIIEHPRVTKETRRATAELAKELDIRYHKMKVQVKKKGQESETYDNFFAALPLQARRLDGVQEAYERCFKEHAHGKKGVRQILNHYSEDYNEDYWSQFRTDTVEATVEILYAHEKDTVFGSSAIEFQLTLLPNIIRKLKNAELRFFLANIILGAEIVPGIDQITGSTFKVDLTSPIQVNKDMQIVIKDGKNVFATCTIVGIRE